MSDRIGALKERIGGVRELESVVNAMRAIAAARSREARERIAGIRSFSEMMGEVIADALALTDTRPGATTDSPHATGNIVVMLCAEQGFVGTLNERIVESVPTVNEPHTTAYFVMGSRGQAVASERGVVIAWSAPMPAHADEAPALASRLADALYDRLQAERVSRVSLVHAEPAQGAALAIVRHALLPFDFARFERPGHARTNEPPLVTMRPAELLLQLAREYVFAQLCEAIMLSYAAENEARMRAMNAALENVHRTVEQLSDSYRRMRQEGITAEIVELSSASGAIGAAERRTD